MKTACCNATLATLGYEDGAREVMCEDCGEDICSRCAAEYEAEDGYDDDGQGVRVHALCKGCVEEAAREERRQMREWRNDSGV